MYAPHTRRSLKEPSPYDDIYQVAVSEISLTLRRPLYTSTNIYPSHLLKVNKNMANVFHNSNSISLTSEERPSHVVLLAAIKTDWCNHPVTDDGIDAITLRWQQKGYPQGLSLEDHSVQRIRVIPCPNRSAIGRLIRACSIRLMA